MSEKKCPYPGLRPFTEDEAIYFKGRDAHIRQIIRQLEDNKIVIITGASGDGKSSLVYAGVIPNARAGFFRAKHNNWLIADFRPERRPLKNLSQVVANNFGLQEKEAYDELSLGFSALTDIYKAGSYHLDEDSEEWKNATLNERKQMKSKASNLLILADQFEEFFTNNENFSQGKPSNESYTTINLLLETAAIALREDLPIYVVFTMRSDFISQCVAFKGLPEAIGFSQFFIPRLRRNELQQVIEEPAILSGGNVSKRLTEVLINDLREGFDRLPVLQHALNQLWQAADDGEETLDLIHLAKLAGMPNHLLPEEDEKRFSDWLFLQDSAQRQYYEQAELPNVLNTHANQLYEKAFSNYTHYRDWAVDSISEEDAELIQKIAFQSLTKIDGGRAVRNRMTLREITEVINQPHISYESVCAVLNIFRLPDSTFIRPFIDHEDVGTQYVAADIILDITHEALIRNWKTLGKWLEEEQANHTDYLDFRVQLNRWLANDKKDEFLLSLGSLSFFKGWFERCRPNKYWIAKYDDSSSQKDEKLAAAAVLADNAAEFIAQSEAFIQSAERRKKRIRGIALIGSLIVIVILSGFSYWATQEKAFAEEQQAIAKRQQEIAELEKNKALKANQIAENEKQKAQASAQTALLAKQRSDSAFQEANRQRRIAMRQKRLAQQESERAVRQTHIAEKQRHEAERERKIATEQKRLAIEANDSAQKLSYLFIAKALAYKAINDYKQPQLNLLLARQAYNFHSKYLGRDNAPEIVTGMRLALNYDGYKNRFRTDADKPISMGVYSKDIYITEQMNSLLHYHDRFENPKVIEVKNRAPINRSFFFEEFAVFTFENRRSSILRFNDRDYRLKGHKGLIRCVALSQDKKFLASGARDGSVILRKYKNLSEEAEVELESRPTAIVFKSDNSLIYISTIAGDIWEWDWKNKKKTKCFSSSAKVLSMAALPNFDKLFVGLSSGKVHMLDTENKFTGSILVNSPAGVNFLTVDPSARFFAAGATSGQIKVYDLLAIQESPLVITDHNAKLKALAYSENRLWALTEDNYVYFWEKDYRVYADELKKRLKRNFTETEWGEYVGAVPYEETIPK